MLGASYQLYRRTGTNDTTILRTVGYALPAVLHPHVQTVVPTTYFASKRTLWKTPRTRSVNATADIASRELLSSRNDGVKPSDLRTLYKTSAYVPAATDRNVLGIAGFTNDFPSPTDLTTFMRICRTDAVDATYDVVKVNDGEYDPSHPDSEANQNVQYTQAIACPTPHIFYSIGGDMEVNPETNEPAEDDAFLQWLQYLINLPNVPQTISASYGDYEKDVPREYAKVMCDLYAKLGALGASVLFPSGNNGVGEGNCKADDGSESVQFIPEFPASCMCKALFLGSSTPS
jgi:tripeptidyl-peptidase-1